MLVNIDDRAHFNNIINNTITDHVLGLPEIPWSMRFAPRNCHIVPVLIIDRWKFHQHSLSAVDEREPPLDLKEYAGTYRDPGFGEITLTLPSQNNPKNSSLAADFAKVDATYGIIYKLQLQASWSRLWARHVRLVSIGENRCTCLPIISDCSY